MSFTGAELTIHLWQSTAFLGAVALLTLALKRHRAETRYRLWMAASLKFLLPFSWLIGFGSHLSWRTAPVEAPRAAAVFFETAALPAPPVVPEPHSHGLPVAPVLAALWFLGALFVLLRWAARYRQVRAAVRAAEPLAHAPVRIMRSRCALEPGVFGIFRPVLVIPAAVLDRAGQSHLKAIVAHELCHIRRRDNLAAALHMLVEALFWFHPLVWWLGSRLVAERELACDEEVLRSGVAPHSYAESILQVCRICLESPVPCVAGITGADLNRRIERIMSGAAALRLGFAKRLLLAAAAACAVAVPLAIGVWNAPPIRAQQPAGAPLAFEAASIKPSKPGNRNHLANFLPGGKFTAENVSVKALVGMAYHLEDYQVSGGAAWTETDGYDVNARPESAATREQTRLMLQALLAQRFHLEFHRETKEMSIYAMTAAKGGLKLQPVHQDKEGDGDFRAGGGHLRGQGATMSELASMLGVMRERPVIDMTGISGKFDIKLEWTPDQFRRGEPGENSGGAQPHEGWQRIDPDGPDFFTATEQQLGLKLEARKGPVQILVIDRVEKPTDNYGLTRRLQQSTAFLLSSAVPSSTAQPNSQPAFDVVSVKRSPTDATERSLTHHPGAQLETGNATVRMLIFLAYQIMPYQLEGGPKWMASDGFDIQAKPTNPKASPAEFRQMVERLLADRFALRCHKEIRDLPVYDLVAARNGPKLTADTSDNPEVTMRNGRGEFTAVKATMDMFAGALTRPLQRQVVNRTGLTGAYTFTLRFEPDQGAAGPDAAESTRLDENPALATALREQLGLNLKASHGPVEVLVVDGVEKPTEN